MLVFPIREHYTLTSARLGAGGLDTLPPAGGSGSRCSGSSGRHTSRRMDPVALFFTVTGCEVGWSLKT